MPGFGASIPLDHFQTKEYTCLLYTSDVYKRQVRSVINNRVGDIPFQIGVLDLTVNFGKTLIMTSLYLP